MASLPLAYVPVIRVFRCYASAKSAHHSAKADTDVFAFPVLHPRSLFYFTKRAQGPKMQRERTGRWREDRFRSRSDRGRG